MNWAASCFSSRKCGPSRSREKPEASYVGLDHLGLRVNNIDAVCSELKAKGAEFTVEPKTIRPGVRIAFVRGPQDVLIEILDRDVA